VASIGSRYLVLFLELSGIRHRATSRADRRQVRFDAVQLRHRSEAITPGAVGCGPTGRYCQDQPFWCSPPLPLDPEPSESRACAAESNYCRHTWPNRQAASAPARSVVTSVERTQVAWGHQRLAIASRASTKDGNVRVGLQSLSRRHTPSCLHLRPGQRGRWYEPDKSRLCRDPGSCQVPTGFAYRIQVRGPIDNPPTASWRPSTARDGGSAGRPPWERSSAGLASRLAWGCTPARSRCAWGTWAASAFTSRPG
jgi:hypothetical protein